MFGDTFDFVGQPPVNMNMGIPIQPVMPQQQMYTPPVYNEPEVTVTGGGAYKIPMTDPNRPDKSAIKVDNETSVVEKKKSNRSKKETVNSNEIIKASNTEVVEDVPTINTYFETAGMIKQAMDQIDTVLVEVKQELDNVRQSRTLKSKYNVMVGLSGNLSDLMNAKINAIKELNNCISKSNDMDYKKQKDRKDAMMGAGSGDELAVMNMYKNIVNDPMITLGQAGQRLPDYMIQQLQQQVTPSNAVSGIVRAGGGEVPVNATGGSVSTFDPTQDTGYINYMANMPASMNALLMEQNPDIKEVVVFDASTGAKWFQVMNTKTNQVIPNMQVTDQMFMEDTTLNIKNKTAQNLNLGKVYPLVVINDNVTSQY